MPTASYRAERHIPAPPAAVWQVLTDLDGYRRWNPFTPRVSGQLEQGRTLLLWARVGPLLMPLLERVEVLDAERELTWGTTWPLGLLRGRRTQRLQPSEGGCVYETEETFDGLLVPLVDFFAAGLVRRGFEETADCLARAAEETA